MNLNIESGNAKSSQKIEVEGITAFAILNSTAKVNYTEYKGMGRFITSINGVAQNSTHSWMYFVNGNLSVVSADNYYPNNNDNISFVFMSNAEAGKYFK